MSRAMFSSIWGRWTLTITSRPSCSTARWTWAMDAAAMGAGSNEVKRESRDAPRSFSMIALASAKGNGATESVSLDKFLCVLKGKEIGPAREDLAQLDERGAQFLEHEPEPLRSRSGRGRATAVCGT